MDPTSQQDIPIPINITFPSGGHGHTIHHHRHRDNDRHQYENDYLSLHNNTIQSTGALQLRVQHIPCNPTINGSIPASHENLHDDDVPQNDICNDKKQHDHHDDEEMIIINYRECLKNHAASMGGCATDGCGEFMPSGQRGTLEALICSACNCHRNFHRKELQGHHHQSQGLMPTSVVASSSCYNYHGLQRPHHLRMMVNNKDNGSASRKVANMVYPAYSGATTAIPCMPVPPLMSTYNMAGRPDDLHHVGGGGVLMMGKYRGGEPPTPLPPLSHQQLVAEMNGNNKKRRFRTKFTQEQKEKMFNFAEKVGWKIQKQEDSVVQQLCQEIGIKRRALKIWMHNNKHNLARKISSSTKSPPPPA